MKLLVNNLELSSHSRGGSNSVNYRRGMSRGVMPTRGGASRITAPRTGNQNWMEDCYWPKSGAGEQSADPEDEHREDQAPTHHLPNQCHTEPIRSQNLFLSDNPNHPSDSERMQPYQMQPLRAQRSGNHFRVLALNNQFSQWKHSSDMNKYQHSDQINGDKSYIRQSLINGFDNNSIDELDESLESPVQQAPLQAAVKFKSRIPFSPKSYRKKPWNVLLGYCRLTGVLCVTYLITVLWLIKW